MISEERVARQGNKCVEGVPEQRNWGTRHMMKTQIIIFNKETTSSRIKQTGNMSASQFPKIDAKKSFNFL